LRYLELPYSVVAALSALSALADFIGMRMWGGLSDRTGNKPVIVIAAVCAAPVPLLMLPVTGAWSSTLLLLPIVYAGGGFFLAGYNLCTANILFNLAPRERDSFFFAWWAALTGIASGTAALIGGFLANWAASRTIAAGTFSMEGLKLVFLLSGVLRFAALLVLRGLREPGSMRTTHALHSILPWRGNLDGQLNIPVQAPVDEHPGIDEAEYWPLFGRREKKV